VTYLFKLHNFALDVTTKKKSKEMLIENEIKLKTILNNIEDIAFLARSDGTFLTVNNALAKSMGMKKEELIDKSMFDFFPGKIAESRKIMLKRMVKSKKPLKWEDDRKGRFFDNFISPILDDNGNVKHVVAVIKDITNRKKTENLFKTQRDLSIKLNSVKALNNALELFLETVIKISEMDGGGIYIVKEDGSLDLECVYNLPSNFVEFVSHYDPDEPNTKLIMKGNPIYTYHKNVIDHGEDATFKAIGIVPIKHKDKVIACLNIASKTLDNIPLDIVNSVETISSQMASIISKLKAEEKLKESEEKYRILFENNVIGVGISDVKGRIIESNEAMCKITGFNHEEQLKIKIPDTYVNPRDRIELFSILKKDKVVKNFEVKLKNKQGAQYWSNISVKPIKYRDKDAFMTTCYDISDRKHAEDVIKRSHEELEKLVEERTFEVEKTHKEVEVAKDHLQNIIDSTSEIIISFNKDNRVDTWNKQAEYITGYRQKDVIGKHASKLNVFNNPQEIIETFQRIYSGKLPESDRMILKTKNNSKIIIKRSCSIIEDNNRRPIGILSVGKNITNEIEIHRKLLPGNSYLISDKKNDGSLNLFINLTSSSCKGLYITRANPDLIKSIIPPKNITTMFLRNTPSRDFKNIPDFERLIKEIKEFTQRKEKSIVYLDRVDYLISNYSFEQFIKSLYQISDIISGNNSMLLLCLEPSVIDEQQFATIRNELQCLPSQQLEDVHIKDSYYDILKLVYKFNKNNILISFKRISQELSVNNKTISKRMKDLEGKQLILIKKQGNQKTAYVTEKAKTLLQKRALV